MALRIRKRVARAAARIFESVGQVVRECGPPLAAGEGSCRDMAVLFCEACRQMRLAVTFVDVTRISRGKIQIQHKRFELADLLHRTVEDHRPEFSTAGVELEVCLLARPLWVNADPTRVAQAVGNLLQNAAKFTGKGGHVTLALDEDVACRTAVIRVGDTGVGISPDVLPRLFQPFMQVDSTLDRSRRGLGLGLALVKGLVELHGEPWMPAAMDSGEVPSLRSGCPSSRWRPSPNRWPPSR